MGKDLKDMSLTDLLLEIMSGVKTEEERRSKEEFGKDLQSDLVSLF